MTNLSWLPYPGSPTQWFSQRWPQTTTNGASQPAFLLQPLGSTPGTWSTSGTGLGINAPATFAGNLLDLQVGGSSKVFVSQSATGERPAAINIATTGNEVSGAEGFFFSSSRYGSGTTKHGLSTRYSSANAGIALWALGNSVAGAAGNGFYVDSSGLGFASGSVVSFTPDVFILRDAAANTLAQRNGTNAQTFRVYNTYSSATNYERAKLEWSSNALKVGTEKGSGGGTARPMSLQTDATDRLTITAVGTAVINTGFTVATLPGTPTTGEIARVTDASAPAVGSTVVGGGAAFALVVYNGANWRVFAI